MSSGLHSLATIIKRLEAATSRLEDLAVAQGAPKSEDQLRDEPNPNAPAAPIPPPSAQASPAFSAPEMAMVEEEPRAVVAYDEQVIDGAVKPFVALTKSFAPEPVVEQAELVEKVFVGVRGVVVQASACKKPDSAGMQQILTPLGKDVEAISNLAEANWKNADWYTHMKFVAAGMGAVNWVIEEPKPGPFIKNTGEEALFFGNRVIKDFKERDAKHQQWVKAYMAIFEALRKYVMEFHTTGLQWNPNGVPLSEYKSASSGSNGAPPPPPPPPGPPPPPPPPATSAAAPSGGGIGAVFADLNRGSDVTKGLRKVDKSEMTHKNPELRASGSVPSSVGAGAGGAGKRPPLPKKPTKPMSLQGKKPAKFALEGNKWLIEYQENESSLIVENVEISQTVNIFGCKNAVVQIKGKCNAVTLVSCTKTSVLVDSVISSIAVTSSPSFTLQITGSAPTIQLDSTDSGQIYLSKACLDVVELITAKCSAINVSLPVEGEEEGVFEEKAVPEMLRTSVKDGQLVTNVVEHSG